MKRKSVQQVVAYIWDIEGLDPVAIDRQTFWPDCHIREIDGVRYAILDWDSCPSWDLQNGQWVARDPDRERLECGHELPMRMDRKRFYVRPGRVCTLCAMGFSAST